MDPTLVGGGVISQRSKRLKYRPNFWGISLPSRISNNLAPLSFPFLESESAVSPKPRDSNMGFRDSTRGISWKIHGERTGVSVVTDMEIWASGCELPHKLVEMICIYSLCILNHISATCPSVVRGVKYSRSLSSNNPAYGTSSRT